MSDEFDPDWVVPPGATIQECLEERCLSKKDFANMSNLSAKQVDDLINGDLTINQDIANMLSRTIGSTSAFWVSLEKNYRDGLIAGKIKVQA